MRIFCCFKEIDKICILWSEDSLNDRVLALSNPILPSAPECPASLHDHESKTNFKEAVFGKNKKIKEGLEKMGNNNLTLEICSDLGKINGKQM